ncbi:MAG TPA: (d)CMP kinase [Clostridiales bacterium]|nr:(d)CMP kinase [Clostridiales bacterium]HPV01960.1 (d)CMP kinase [Clostridiales bacterium]
MNIAIDGPAGAGKSTVAKAISKELGIIYLDTGAMYRAVALKAIQSGIDTRDQEAVEAMVEDIDIRIEYRDSEQRIFLDGTDVTGSIRTPEVSVGASNVAVIPAVRKKMVELQRKIARENDVVMDGRDIGTYVLPDASYKFFLTASLDERAKRRFNEMRANGMAGVSLEEVRKDIEYRDRNDSSRSFAPLSKAPDALEIDTTGISPEEVVRIILDSIKNRKTVGAAK